MNRSEFRNVLVIVAHPDDAELTAGGSIARWVGAGAEVRTAICTNGDKGTKDDLSPFELAAMREKEQLAASKVLGVKETIFLRHRDGELEDTRAFANQLAFLIRYHRPDTVITHDPLRLHYQHPDHRATGNAVFQAIVYARDRHFLPELLHAGFDPHHTNVLLYTASNEPNFFVDISPTFRTKIASVRAHKSQIRDPRRTENRLRRRAENFGRAAGLPLAESFAIARMR